MNEFYLFDLKITNSSLLLQSILFLKYLLCMKQMKKPLHASLNNLIFFRKKESKILIL